MPLRIVWTEEAQKTFDNILLYLAHRWSDKEVRGFINRTNQVLQLISEKPDLYRKSKKRNIHEAVISKHNTLYYQVKKGSITLISFWDNRQSPDKLKL